MKVLMIDNYDSFTFNLVHYLKAVEGVTVDVERNDKISWDKIGGYDKYILSPGPGIPSESGDLMKFIDVAVQSGKPIMGVCLGHQALAEYFGGSIENMNDVYHGLAHSMKIIAEDAIYTGLPKSFLVGRYHSWQVVENDALKEHFIVTGKDDNGAILSMKHKEYPITGVQYHPESVLTEHGKQIMRNWVNA